MRFTAPLRACFVVAATLTGTAAVTLLFSGAHDSTGGPEMAEMTVIWTEPPPLFLPRGDGEP